MQDAGPPGRAVFVFFVSRKFFGRKGDGKMDAG